MLQALFKRIFHFQEMILILSLMALACLPSALGEIVRDASVSLLIPLTLIGALVAWALATRNIDKTLSLFVLVILGPLALYVRIGQIGNSLFEFIKQSVNLVPPYFSYLFNKTSFDPSIFFAARDDLLIRIFTLGSRLSLWFTGLVRGIQIEDPVVRTLIWSIGLWLIAVWAGWQIYRNKRFLAGMLPSTILLAFVIDYTGKDLNIIWLHLALLLFVYGLSNYDNLQKRWSTSQTDYAESTSTDTLILVGALTFGLVSISFLVSTISIRDILADFRERRAGSNEAQAESLGLESIKNNFRVTGFAGGLPRSYLLTAGPELSSQLAMTISTGDLPSMPESARPVVPRYYWRTLTYSIYTGSGWTNPSAESENVPAEEDLLEQPNLNHRIVRAQVTFPNDSGGRLYWTGTLINADIPFQAAWLRQGDDQLTDSDLLAALASVESYTAESILLDVNADELRASPSVYPDWVREQFLVVPDSVPERVLALSRDLTASEATAYDRAIAIQNYLREFPYTLEVDAPPANRDVADYFLFDLKKGYCDYYSTTMAVLARAAGLPARIVVGYANGTYDTERAQYLVTENYAHSWVEIYFADIGWVEFEPTAGQQAIFYEEELAANNPTQPLPVEEESWQSQFTSVFQSLRNNVWIPMSLVFIFGLLWFGFDSLRLNQLDPSRTIQLLYKRLRRLARPVTGYASINQTSLSYSYILIEKLSAIKHFQNWIQPSRNEINQLTDLYSLSLFAPISPTRIEANDAVKTWSRLRWRLLLVNMLLIKK